jgi:hypothetical protein
MREYYLMADKGADALSTSRPSVLQWRAAARTLWSRARRRG